MAGGEKGGGACSGGVHVPARLYSAQQQQLEWQRQRGAPNEVGQGEAVPGVWCGVGQEREGSEPACAARRPDAPAVELKVEGAGGGDSNEVRLKEHRRDVLSRKQAQGRPAAAQPPSRTAHQRGQTALG